MSIIGWIGLGHMGVPMAKHFVDAGHEVIGYDKDPAAKTRAQAAGIDVRGSIDAAVHQADLVFTMLPSVQAVEEVLSGEQGAFEAMPAGAIAVDCSTISIEAALRLEAKASELGLGFVDAPVSGGVQGAVNGDLTLMLGGEPAHVAEVEPMLKHVGEYIQHVGPPGSGQAMKIANNAMMGISMAAASEASVLAQKLGLHPVQFYEIVTRSSGDSWPFRNWFPLPDVVPTSPSSHGYEPGFMIDLVHKDLKLAAALAGDHDVRMETTQAALELFGEASAAGMGRKDVTALALHLGAQDESAGK